MKKRMRRLIGLIMSVVVFVSAMPSVSATGLVSDSSVRLAQIENERAELYSLLEQQLAAQDALEYIDQFSYLVEMTIAQKYYPTTYTDTNKTLALNGGVAYGVDMYYQREAEYYNAEDTEEMYRAAYSVDAYLRDEILNKIMSKAWEALKKTALKELLEAANPLLTAGSIAQFFNDASLDLMWSKIDVGTDGCIINVVHDRMEHKTITVLWRWEHNPYIDLSIYPSYEKIEIKLRGVEV